MFHSADVCCVALQMDGMVFKPEADATEPESRCRVDWDIKCEEVRTLCAAASACGFSKSNLRDFKLVRISTCVRVSCASTCARVRSNWRAEHKNCTAHLARSHKVGSSQALNDHINVEYTASYAYHALFSYFDRDTVGLDGVPSLSLRAVGTALAYGATRFAVLIRVGMVLGLAAFFADQSVEERGHAERAVGAQEFMKYQNIRGGKVVLKP
eukprot:1153652-Rhodomonas_salina.1